MTTLSTPARIDYLAVAAPHGRTFPRAGAADVGSYGLTDQRVADFHRDGFIPRVPIMDPAQVERVRSGLEAIVTRHNGRESELVGGSVGGTAPITYMQGAWMIDEAIHDLVFHPAITVRVAQLLGTRRVRFWHDQVFYKPAKTGGNVAWHQDYSYWKRATPAGSFMSVWIGLDDSSLENGCLHCVPGSHRWPLLAPTDLMGDMERLAKQLAPDQLAQFKPQPLEQPAGTCSFHHDHTVHGSFPNRSDRPRRAIVLNYMADGTRSAADDGILMPGAGLVPKGEVIEGSWFPLVLDLDAVG
ncbi:MAG: phytanoyl-CoA dioxygenase family protein [Planctomycetes bacterium]|nr:phytanoyl-CoA dioxygenase family protein [Planctomycetota bacterium]